MPDYQRRSRTLPANASEEFLRKEAKRYSRQYRINLVAAHRALADEYGCRNWAALIGAVRTVVPTPGRPVMGVPTNSIAPVFRDEEWSAVYRLAALSVTDLPFSFDPKEWLTNRKSFADAGGVPKQFCATLD